MNALRRLAVFLPQMVGVGLAIGGGTLAHAVHSGSLLFVPGMAIAVVSGVVSVITTIDKTDTVTDKGWGGFDPALETSCASCRGYRLNNEKLKRELTEAREALATLRLP